MGIVIAKLPNAGLGNKLFVWANAYVYAYHYNYRYSTFGWLFYSLKYFLKGYKKRDYQGYFIKQYSYAIILKYYLFKLFFKKDIIYNPEINVKTNHKFVIFNQIPHWKDFFKNIRENHEIVYKGFFDMLHPKIYSQYLSLNSPVIAVHIRMGDFRKLNPEEDFKKVGGVRTPLNYFINLINKIREIIGINLPVSVFSDGTDEELQEILKLDNIRREKNEKDILDMLHMSKADIIIPSAGSTFSFWSAFFSKAIVFIHPDHFHSYIRPPHINANYFEGPTPTDWNNYPELLNKNFNQLIQKYSKQNLLK